MTDVEEASTPQSASTHRVAQPMSSAFRHNTSAANTRIWLSAPLDIVGNKTIPLGGYQRSADWVSRYGSGHQQLTSYATLSCGYVAYYSWEFTPSPGSADLTTRQTDSHDGDVLAPIEPTKAQYEALPPTKQRLLTAGQAIYTKDHGVVVKSAIPRLRRKLLAEKNTLRATPAMTNIPTTTSPAHTAGSPAQPSQRTRTPDGQKNTRSKASKPAKTSKTAEAPAAAGIDTLEQPSTSAASRAPAGADQIHGYEAPAGIYPGFLPTRVVATTHVPTSSIGQTPPYTSIYEALNATLNNDTSTTIRTATKAPLIADATNWVSLAKAVRMDTGSHSDVAAFTRLALMAYYTSKQTHHYDTTRLTFVRNIRTTYVGTRITNTPQATRTHQFSTICMPLDTFLTFTSGGTMPESPPSPYTMKTMDIDWIAVPVSNELAHSSYLMVYLAAFFSSDLTFGRVSTKYSYTASHDAQIKGEITVSPASNLAYISGPRSIIIVLTDENTQSAGEYLRLPHGRVPIYRGSMPREAPAGRDGPISTAEPLNFNNSWSAYFTTPNLPKIHAAIPTAWSYMVSKLAIHNTAGEALSAAAELCLAIKPGLYVAPSTEENSYQLLDPLGGGHAISHEDTRPTVPIAEASQYLLQNNDIASAGFATTMGQMIAGYNVSSLSSLHIPPTGLASSGATSDGYAQPRATYPMVDQSCKLYTLPAATSVKRLSAYVGLIDVAKDRYQFDTAEGMAAWLHMLAYATAMNTSAMLLLNDVPLRDWTGFNTKWGPYNRTSEMSEFMREVTGGMVSYTGQQDMHESWSMFSFDWIPAFYGIDPYNSRAWGSYSPVPHYLTVMWIEKLALAHFAPTQPKPISIQTVQDVVFAIDASQADKYTFLRMASSISTKDHHPIVLDRTRGVDVSKYSLGSWVEQVHSLSNTIAGNTPPHPDILQTLTITESKEILFSAPVEARSLAIIKCDALNSTWSIEHAKYSPCIWPDPPTFTDILEIAKNYMLMPALTAFGGFATGGPVGAAVAGGGALLGQVLSDISKNREQSRLKDQIRAELLPEVLKHQQTPSQAPPAADAAE
ncbi:capsid protein [Ceratitis capitata totivirus 1]|nr:capsid protein [Ceratitis capitata totivirus 1]